MNPPRSRFVRGRGRGGGPYRPYFYFSRNGRVIPAGNNANNDNNPTIQRGNGGRGYFPQRARYRRPFITANTSTDADIIQPTTSRSILRPENYAAPKEGIQINCIAINYPVQCPGWCLYFGKEEYKEDSLLAKRIKMIENHIKEYSLHYNLQKIALECQFDLNANVINMDEQFKKEWPNLLNDIKTEPYRTLATFGAAMYSVVTAYAIQISANTQQCTENLFIPRFNKPNKIRARPIDFIEPQIMCKNQNDSIDKLYCVRGTVITMSDVDMPATWIAYKCPRCKQEQALAQRDFKVTQPYSCKRPNCLAKKGFIEIRSSPFTRITPQQIIRLSETHIQASLESEEREIFDIELRNNLVDCAIVGQEVVITGILKLRPITDEYDNCPTTSSKIKEMDMFLKALSIIDAKKVKQNFTDRDMDAINMIKNEPDTFKLLVHSIAPELHGEELVKASVLLSLFGGSGSQLHDDSEINVLLVGDPGLGKSHVLQMCSKVAPKGIFVNGKQGSTGNQLLPYVQGRTNHNIEAGALATSSNGNCVIDDIDRLSTQQDNLVQILESKKITLPYSSFLSKLIIPTSVIATANPIRGHYDNSKSILENIRVNPALLTKFHLVFSILDRPNALMDMSLTEHIRSIQAGDKKSATIAARFNIKPKTNESMNVSDIDLDEIDDENYSLAERLKLTEKDGVNGEGLDLLPPILIKKYIAYAREKVKPLLTSEASELLKEFYLEIRKQKSDERTCIISTCHLEGLIRLSQARARINLAAEVTKVHVRDILSLVRHSIADTTIGDYVDTEPAANLKPVSQRGLTKKFIQALQHRSDILNRRIFDFDEIKDIARNVGISCGVTDLIDKVNLQGFLLKKGPNLYEVMTD